MLIGRIARFPKLFRGPESLTWEQIGEPLAGFSIQIYSIFRTRHDSEVQGGVSEQAPPSRGATGPSYGMVGAGHGWEGQVGGWRDNNQEMEDFEMEMDN